MELYTHFYQVEYNITKDDETKTTGSYLFASTDIMNIEDVKTSIASFFNFRKAWVTICSSEELSKEVYVGKGGSLNGPTNQDVQP